MKSADDREESRRQFFILRNMQTRVCDSFFYPKRDSFEIEQEQKCRQLGCSKNIFLECFENGELESLLISPYRNDLVQSGYLI